MNELVSGLKFIKLQKKTTQNLNPKNYYVAKNVN